jgi:ankyrin repeat protein
MTNKNSKSLLWVSLAGILVLLVVGGIGWTIMFAEQSKVNIEKSEIDQFVWRYGSDVKAVDGEGGTLLHTALINRRGVDVINFLVSEGADINIKHGLTNWTPLHWAVANKYVEAVKILVSWGADVDVKDDGGWTPLTMAVNLEDVETIKFLISNGADVNATSNNNCTALHMAVNRENIEIIKLLVSAGADGDVKTKGGNTPLDYAKEQGYAIAVEYLSNIR